MLRKQTDTEKLLLQMLRDASPDGLPEKILLDDIHIGFCEVIDFRYNTLLDAVKRLQTRLHAIETRGEIA